MLPKSLFQGIIGHQPKEHNMQYVIVTADSTEDLQAVVMEYIDEGFKPVGGPFVTQMDRGTPSDFAQAMIKE